ncbi:MAG: LamG-like jellyroll fold domain-containing protein, partial [Sphingobacteriaceae bacterium]|nr:LamG-like jellyroll fold domain-containing protein [Sphingobacteriaceae bacterium]
MKSAFLTICVLWMTTVATAFSPKNQTHLIANAGQWEEKIIARYQTATAVTQLTKDGLEIHLLEADQSFGVALKFSGHNPNPQIQAYEEVAYKANFLHGKQSYSAKAHRKYVYKSLYEGIDWHVVVDEDGHLKHEFHLAPFADPTLIQWTYEGKRGIQLAASGALHIQTPLGNISESKPISWQANNLKAIASTFKLNKNKSLSFELGHYDRSQAIVIDPVLRWSTYIGGANTEKAWDVAVHEASGKVFVVGEGNSPALNTIGTTASNRIQSAYVACFDAAGNQLWLTYLGVPPGLTAAQSISISQDANPAIYVAGTAQGTDNSIATAGAHKAVRSGQSDIFLARLDSAGQVQWGTYFGSTSSDFDPVIRLNSSGTKLYVGGTTTGNNGIASAGVHRAARQSDFQTHEGFVAVFSNTGQFERGSYVNGASEVSRVYALALRGDSVLVGGATSGGSVFGTGGSYTTLGGARDGFMMMFNPNLGFVFSSFIGGSGNDDIFALALTSDAIYVGGETFSNNRMATSGAAQLSFGGNSDAFLMRFNLNGQIQWGTYLGGVVADGFKDIVVSNDNFIYALGRTTSTGNIAFNAMQTALNGSANVLLAKYNSQGARQFSTYLGAGEMVGEGLAITNTDKRIYMAGRAFTGNFSTPGAFNQTRQGEDGFLTAVTDSRAEILSINPHCLNSPVTYRLLTSNLLAGDSVFIRALDAFSNIINVDTIIYSSGDTLTRTIPANRLTGLTGQQLALDARLNAGTPNRFPAGTAWVTAVNQLSIPSQVSSPQNICSGSNISLWLTTAGGRNRRIVWEKDGVVLANQPPANDPTAITFQVNAQSAGTYRARVTDDCGADLYTQPMVVNALAAPALLAIANQNSCTGGSLTLTASGTDTLTGKTYFWQRNGVTIANSSDSVLRLTNLTAAQAGNYTVRATGNGCTSNIVSFTVQVKAALSAGFKPGAQRLCPGNSLSISLSSSNHDSIRWFLNNQLIAGASSTTYSKSNISTADAGVYKAQIFYCDSVVTFDSISVQVSNTFSADDGLTHYFPFDNSPNEIITGTAPVSSSITYGNGRQATQAAGRNAVMAGNGLTYNGLNVPTANQAFSVSFYHRLELTSAFGTLLEWTWPSTGTNAFRITRNALFGYQLTFAGQTDVVNLTGIGTFDAWIHTTVTYDGQVLRCFINGQQQFVKNISWQASGTVQLQIGRGASGNINRISIDEVRVYNRALSTQEINVLKDQPEVVYTESTLSSCGSDSLVLAATVFPSNTNNGFQWLADGQAIAGATNLQQSILAANNTARKFKLNTKLAGCFEIGSGQIEVVDTVSITNGLLDLWSYAFSIPQGGGTGNLFYANVSSFSNDRFNRSNGALLITAKTAGATYAFGSAQPRLSYMIWYQHNQAGNTNQLSTLFSNDAYSHLSFYNDRLVAPGNANNLTPLSNDTLVDNQWYHVAVTFEGTTYRYYLNGRLIATRTGQPNIDNNQINGIFNRSTVGGQGALGAFNDLRVYNYRVSPSLLNQLYYQPLLATAGSSSLCEGGSTTEQMRDRYFPASAFQFQWYRNNVLLAGSTTDALQFSNVSRTDSGVYSVEVSGPCLSTARRNQFTLNVLPIAQVLTQPTSVTICTGDTLRVNLSIDESVAVSSVIWFNAATGNSRFSNLFSQSAVGNRSFVKANASLADTGLYVAQIRTTSGGCQIYSDTIRVSISAPPSLQLTALDTTLCLGTNFSLGGLTGGGTTSRQWLKNGQAIPGATADTLQLSNLDSTASGTYRLVAVAGCRTDTSQNIVIRLRENLSITTQPQSQTLCVGDTLQLSVQPSISAGVQIQWYKDGVAISGANNATYSLASVQSSLEGLYHAEVRDHCKVLQSDTATVLINALPAITTQSARLQTVCLGDSISLNVSATGGRLQYQWFKNGSSLSNQLAASLSFSSITAQDSGSYRLQISNSCGQVFSDTFQLLVPVTPIVTQQPVSGSFCQGASVTLTVAANQLQNVTGLQWFKNQSPIAGATSLSYTIAAFGASDSASYQLKLFTNCDTIVSNAAVLQYIQPAVRTGNLSANSVYCLGQSLNLTFNVSNASLEWFKNGQRISNAANSTTFNISALAFADSGYYQAVATSQCDTFVSDSVFIRIIEAPFLLGNPIGAGAFCSGSAVNLSHQIGGNINDAQFQWFKDGQAISGANQSSLAISQLGTAQVGRYTLQLTSACGVQTSDTFNVRIYQAVQFTSTNSSTNSFCAGDSTGLSLSFSGDVNSFQWYRNNQPIANANSNSYLIPAFNAQFAGNYFCVVTGPCNTDTSATFDLLLEVAPQISSAILAVQSFCTGDSVRLQANFSGTNLTYQWHVNGQLQAQNSSAFSLLAQGGDSLKISVRASNQCGLAFDSTLILVRPITAITQQPSAPASLCIGSSLNLQATAAGHNLSYQWTRNGSPISGATQPTFNIASLTAADASSYRLIVTGSCGSDTSVAVVVQPLALTSIIAQPQSANSCLGNATTFHITALGAGLSYTWLVNGTAQNVNADSLVFNPAVIGTFNIRAIVTGSCGTDTSSMAVLEVRPV